MLKYALESRFQSSPVLVIVLPVLIVLPMLIVCGRPKTCPHSLARETMSRRRFGGKMESQMEKWNINEVCDFLSENDFDEDIVECFRVNKIRGRVLFLLSEDDMKQLGLGALGDRKYFQHVLHKRRDKEKAENTVRILLPMQ